MPRLQEHYAETQASGSGGRPQVALVLDAHQKSSLAAIRSLGRRGTVVCAGSHRAAAMGFYSRYSTSRFVYPSPLQDRAGFVESVIRQADRFGSVALLCFSDASVLPMMDAARIYPEKLLYLMPTSQETVDLAFDKALTLQLAERLGVATPPTYVGASEEDFGEIGNEFSYPLVLKPRRSVCWTGQRGTQRTTVFASSREDLKKKYAALYLETGEYPLIQKYLRGEETGVEFMCRQGVIVGACAHRRLRSLSPTGGAAVLSETIPLSSNGIGAIGERFVGELQWSGPIMVEFKTDSSTGLPTLMEINGRFWGSLPLAIAAGVDFPSLYYRLARGENVPPAAPHQPGVISRHRLGDLHNLMRVLFKHDPMRRIAYPGRMRALATFCQSQAACRSDVWDTGDPKPSVAEVMDALARVIPENVWLRSAGHPPNAAPTRREDEKKGRTLYVDEKSLRR